MNVRVKEIAYYHPKKVYSNDFFINQYDEIGVDIRGLLEVTGRNQRYASENESETSLTMAIEAAKKVMDKAKVDAEELNLIVYVSCTPEFLSPTNALKIHHALKGGKHTMVYDINCNCVGMVVAMEQVCRMMKSNANVKHALVVGSEQLKRYARVSEPITFANFGESACAILLENVMDGESDFIDSSYYTDSSLNEYIMFPPKGFSQVLPTDKSLPKDEKVIQWLDFDTDDAFASSVDSINEILTRNNLTKKDIKKYCLSQFAKKNIDLIRKTMDEPEEKYPFVGDEFGYTGATSPFLAFAKCIENNEIKRGDNVIFWSVGAGVTCSCILMKY